jgi:hypothetical protein
METELILKIKAVEDWLLSGEFFYEMVRLKYQFR